MDCHCIHRFGQSLRAETRPDMVPSGAEVILDVTACGVCHTDLHLREGGLDLGRGQRLDYGARGITLPLTPGHEIVGRVRAVGPDVAATGARLDPDRHYVVYPWGGCGQCDACRRGDENLCPRPRFLGVHVDGGYATQVRIPHPRHLFDIGDLSPQQAAPLACSGLTTYAALKKIPESARSMPALVLGAGGLGLACLALIRAQGLPAPVVVDIDPAKRAAALDAGAGAAIDPRAPDAIAAIHAACGGAPLAAIDLVGAESTAELGFNALAKGGTLVLVGLFGGAAPWPLPMIALKTVTICGSYVGSLTEFAELMALARSGALGAIPAATHPLAQADAVMTRLEQGGIIGRAVLSAS